ncbi:hypothetical protein [Mycolicibacterium alvei]|uniref:Uncharacterized protein n=1 Tax=Mycolicibacterium alvei TaxID=67081 RepID=A0A6N4V1U7_9MYCO|nr:hypothetical protein [Mycolicibacterium alvei]MCV7000081.1 hypothetical protein [Mycolicibacterium alvei]BBX30113.1 hypothetical protein MALV_52380 [Mycolicibacterium alvei]
MATPEAQQQVATAVEIPAVPGTAIPGGRGATVIPIQECAELFDELAAPREEALQGVYRGRVVAVSGAGSLPGPLRRLISVVAPRSRFPWYGKAFDGCDGANVWLTSTGRFQRFSYSIEYGERHTRLCYDRMSNPRLLRKLEAEIRTLAPGRYLCRASYGARELLYFTLEA